MSSACITVAPPKPPETLPFRAPWVCSPNFGRSVSLADIAAYRGPDPDGLIACPTCDALYRAPDAAAGQRVDCARCHETLATPRRFAGMRIIALAMTTLILIVSASMLPFLQLDARGLSSSASIIDAAMAFSGPRYALLALATAALILVIPAARMLLILYVLVPLVFDRPPASRAKAAFRLSESLRPWSMAEIFALGCAVALVKLADLARIEFGPAFFMFTALVMLAILQEHLICRWSVWEALEGAPG